VCTRISRVDKCATSTKQGSKAFEFSFFGGSSGQNGETCGSRSSLLLCHGAERRLPKKALAAARALAPSEKGPHYRIRTHYLSPLLCFIVITWHLNINPRAAFELCTHKII
jgi:hypothetical protein